MIAHILYFKKNPDTVYIPMGVTAALTLVDHGVDVAVNVIFELSSLITMACSHSPIINVSSMS